MWNLPVIGVIMNSSDTAWLSIYPVLVRSLNAENKTASCGPLSFVSNNMTVISFGVGLLRKKTKSAK